MQLIKFLGLVLSLKCFVLRKRKQQEGGKQVHISERICLMLPICSLWELVTSAIIQPRLYTYSLQLCECKK